MRCLVTFLLAGLIAVSMVACDSDDDDTVKLYQEDDGKIFTVRVGEDIKIHTGFTNTGQAPLNPHIILEIQTQDGVVLERFEDTTTGLTAGSEFLPHWEWTPTVARGQCCFRAYALYDGKSTPIIFYPEISIVSDGDFNEDGKVNLIDFAQLAQAWLNNTPLYDIAPDGGDCMVDLLDLDIIANNWLNK